MSTLTPERDDAAGPEAGHGGSPNPGYVRDDGRDPVRELGVAFKSAMAAVRRMRGRETHRPGQLSYAQFGVLHNLGAGCSRSAREIAEQADLTPATVTQMLESLEAAGLVRRERSVADRRVVLSALTDRGEQVVAARHAELEPKWRAALAEFSASELDTAARVLHRLAEHFTALGDGAS